MDKPRACHSSIAPTDLMFVGIDIGTSSVRCTAIDTSKKVIASSRTNLPAPENPQPGWFHQEPQLWWQAVRHGLKDLSDQLPEKAIQSIAVDGTSSTVLLVDNNNQPVCNALMYNDSRASKLSSELTGFIPVESITRSASSSLSKAIFLLQDNATRQRARHIMHQADWINAMLTGNKGVGDENNSLKLGYDSENQQWPDWLSNAPFELSYLLPVIVQSGTDIGAIDPAIASEVGLPTGVRIIAGTTDSTASTLATGISQPGEAVTTYGTTMVMKMISSSPVTSVQHGIYSHHLPNGFWLVGGASNSGGNVLEKFFSVKELDELSSRIDISTSSGLEYYPLAGKGERFPVNDAEFEPKLDPRPDSDVLFLQGIFEGFASIEKQAYQLITCFGAPLPTKILTAGGKASENQALT
ncbi:MAG: FGGY-family carbohydrate kinase, partial [Gammaproteobacteria bacterium]|nr:FGGY-family carbohydrate kinase [Gammaproteobacteria bacterium]